MNKNSDIRESNFGILTVLRASYLTFGAVISPVLLGYWHPDPHILFAFVGIGCLLVAIAAIQRVRSGSRQAVDLMLGIVAVVLLPVSLIISPFKDDSALYGLYLLAGIAAYFAVSSFRANEELPSWSLLLGGVTAFIGLFGMAGVPKFPVLSDIQSFFPLWTNTLLNNPSGFAPNEVAGILTLFVPLSMAVLLFADKHQGRTPQRTFGLIAAGLILLTWLIAQSRGAVLAGVIGCAVALLWLGRRGIIACAAGAAAAILAGFLIEWERIVQLVSYNRRFDDPLRLFTGRDEIWAGAWQLFADFPVLGTGFNSGSVLTAAVYPRGIPGRGAPPTDAHNMILQTGLDFGVLGIVLLVTLFVYLIIVLYRSAALSQPKSIERIRMAGLLGGIAAFVLYNLTDCIALGSRTGIIFFLWVGLAVHASHTGLFPGKRFAIVTVIVALAVTAYAAVPFCKLEMYTDVLPRLGKGNRTEIRITTNKCEPTRQWYAGYLAHLGGSKQRRDSLWLARLEEKAPPIAYMRRHVPRSLTLSSEALQRYPHRAEVQFWVADAMLSTDTSAAVTRYLAGLSLDSSDGLAWLHLGDALIQTDTVGAFEAYRNACFHNDPGLNGCYRAGKTALLLGDTATAISLFETSAWVEANALADSLKRHFEHGNSGAVK